MTAETGSDLPRPMVGVVSTRMIELSPTARAVHKAILRTFATAGHAPDPATLAAPDGCDLAAVLNELHDQDVVRLDGRGRIRAAYPFSAVPTPHRVAIADGPTVHAMCAIDALGVAAMLGATVTVSSTDPGSGQPIRVSVRPDGHATWQPPAAVVVDGTDTTMDGGCCPPEGDGRCAVAAADRCCGVMNFFTSTASVQAWLAAHPHVSGTILTREQALGIGIDIFGPLLDD